MIDKLLPRVERRDYKSIITNDCELVIDTDLLTFSAASSAEMRSVVILSKELDFEKEFKTRTEFRGRSKKDIAGTGSYLDDWNTERKLKGLKELKPSDFEFKDVQTPFMSFELVCRNFDASISRIKEHLGVNKATLYTKTGGGPNFRNDLVMSRMYKSQRKDQLKPLFLKQLRDYVSRRRDCVDVQEGLEVDDVISIEAFNSYRHYLKTGKFNKIVVCLDKDSLTHPGLQFCFQKDERGFMYPYPLLIPDSSKDIGALELRKGKVVGYGLAFLCHQLSYGDTSDMYSSYMYLDLPRNTFGEKMSYELFSQCKTPTELLEALKSHYKRIFPDGRVKFNNWDGTPVDIHWFDWLETQFQCAYMKRSYNDTMTARKLFERFGVTID